MATTRLTPLAMADLARILGELNRSDPAIAGRYADAVDQKSQALAMFPESGRMRPELAPGLRSTLVSPYVILYRIEGDEVQILRIVHGSRDLTKIMRRKGR